jgi:archaellum component FlaC
MNNELKELLSSVLKEELQPINKRFDGFEQRLDGIDKRLDGFDERLDGIDKRLDGFDERLDGIDKRLNGFEQRFERVENGINELKSGQEQLQKNLIVSLGNYTEKIVEHVDDKTGALNKRVFAVETEVQRLTRI